MYEEFAQDLKKSRKNAHMTQLQVAVTTGYAPETIKKYEKGVLKASEDYVSKAKVLFKDRSLGIKYLSKVSKVGQEEIQNLAAMSEFCRHVIEVMPQLHDTLNAFLQLAT